MRIKPKALVIGFCWILLCAATAGAKGWRGIVPLHSTRSQVERLLGPPTEDGNTFSVVYKTPNETVLIDYAEGSPCGIGEKYSQWRVARHTVTSIFISPHPDSPLSKLSIDESRYKKFTVGHLSETRYVNAREGEVLTVLGNEVGSITYFAAADDSHLECPGLPKANNTNCEYLPDPFDSLGDLSFEQEELFLDTFFFALTKRKALAYIIAYGGKRARPNEARNRADRARKYLVDVRHFPAGQIKVIDGGYREKRDLSLYVVSDGICPPTPDPTVDPRDVEIITRGRARKSRTSPRSSSNMLTKNI